MSFDDGFILGLSLGGGGGGGSSAGDKWIRPSDWPELGTPNDNQIIMLITTQWNTSPYESFSVWANQTFGDGMSVTVDWGDGNIESIELPSGEPTSDNLGHYYYDRDTYAWNEGPVLNNGAHVFVIKITLPDNVYWKYGGCCELLDIHIGANVRQRSGSLSLRRMLAHVKFFGWEWSEDDEIRLDYNRSLRSVESTIPFQIIPYEMFKCCSNIRDFDFSMCREIRRSAFYQSGICGEINAPLLETVGASAFYECMGLETVESPLLSSVESAAFSNCCLLQNISHADGWTYGSGSFSYCYNYYDNPQYNHPPMDIINN